MLFLKVIYLLNKLDELRDIAVSYTHLFVDIKFNDIYIHSSVFGAENIQRLEFILQHANHQPGCIRCV